PDSPTAPLAQTPAGVSSLEAFGRLPPSTPSRLRLPSVRPKTLNQSVLFQPIIRRRPSSAQRPRAAPLCHRSDAGASEKARVLAAEQSHDIGEREVAEIGRGRQAVLDHLIGLGHDLGHVRHVELTDVRAENLIEPGGQWLTRRLIYVMER